MATTTNNVDDLVDNNATAPYYQLTSKGNADVVVQHRDLADRPGVLELERRLLLDAEHDARLAADADLMSAVFLFNRAAGQSRR